MQVVRTSSSLLFSSCPVFFLSCAESPWFSFYLFIFLFWLINRTTEEVVWRGWMTNLLCSFCIVWRQGAGHRCRTQVGDGSLGSRNREDSQGDPGYTTCSTNCCRHLKGCFGLSSACNVPLFIISLLLCLTLFTSSGGFVFYSFFPARFFSSVGHLACGGGTTDCFFYLIFFLSICLLCLRFLFDCFLFLLFGFWQCAGRYSFKMKKLT